MSSPRRLPAEPPMTVEAALRVPALRRGQPRLLAGRDALHRPVRWAHSCEARHVPDLLEGQELLLMTGMGLASGTSEQRAFVRALVAKDVAAVVIELGRVFRELPEALVREARRHHLPLVALEHEVRFVEATKQLHTAILQRQMRVEHEVGELQRRLTDQLLDGADVGAVLDLLAHALGNPVLLERADGQLLGLAAGQADPEEALASWRLVRDGPAQDDETTAVAALHEPGRRAWGQLVVVGLGRPVDAATRLAVARVAPLLALVLVRARGDLGLEGREHGGLLHDVVLGRVAPEDVPAHLGTALRAERLLPFAVAGRSAPPAGTPQGAVGAAAGAVEDALRAVGAGAVVGARPDHDDLLGVLALAPGQTREAATGALAAALGLGAAAARAAALSEPAALRSAAQLGPAAARSAAPSEARGSLGRAARARRGALGGAV